MNAYTLNVTDYTLEPYSRYKEDKMGGNGETFRKQFVIPKLEEYDSLIINLDGIVDDYGSSFLSEAFAMLILQDGYSYDEISRKIKFVSENNERLHDIEAYLLEAKTEVQGKSVKR